MKKRLIVSLLLAVILMVSMPASVFAAPQATATPVLTVESKNLSLKDNVQPVFDVYYDGVEATDVKLLLWTSAQTDYSAGTESVALTPYAVDADTLRFYYTDLTAKQMTDDLYVRPYADGVYGDLVKFSVLEYAYTKLGYIGNSETTDEDLKSLLGEMLEYGAAAQKYLDYKTDRLATADFHYVTVSGATLSDGTTAGLFIQNETIALTAAAQNGNGDPFSAWLVNGNKQATTQAFTYTVQDEDADIVAAYGSLASISVVNGTLGDGETEANAFAGSQITLTAKVAPNGYVFKYWKDADGTVVGTERTSTVTVTKDTIYKAYYELGFGNSTGTPVEITWQQGGINGNFTTFNTSDPGRVSFDKPIFLQKGATLKVTLPIDIENAEDCLWTSDGNNYSGPCTNGCTLGVGIVLLNKNENGAVTENDIIPGYQFAVTAANWQVGGCNYTAAEDVYIMITVKSSLHASVRKFYTDDPKLDEVEVYLLNPNDEIPAGTYWQAELADGIAKIEANREAAGTEGLSEFFYLTDSHWPDNAGFSPALINYIAEKVDAYHVNFGGDIIRRYNAVKQDAIDLEINGFYHALEKYTEAGEKLKIMTTLGNHDRNGSSNQPDVNGRLTEQEAYDLYMKRMEGWGVTYEGDSNRSYYDDTANKVRYVQFYFAGSQHGMIEDGFVADALTWAEGVIRELDSDWTVVLMTHGVLCGAEGTANEFTPKDEEVIKRILKLQGEADAEIALWITGHIHEDRNIILSDDANNKIRLVSLNADAYGNSNSPTSYQMKPGTVTEQSFSFLQVDTKAQMIYLTRFGAGGDLKYGYGANISYTTSEDVDEKVFHETVNIRIHNGTTADNKTFVNVETGSQLTFTALDITGHTFSHWVDKDGNTIATTKTVTVTVAEANTYRPVYTAQEGYKAVANDWFQGSYDGSMTAWAGEGHTVDTGSKYCTRLTSHVFTLKAGETISFTYTKDMTATNGTATSLAMGLMQLTAVEGSDTGDIFTDYTTSSLPGKTGVMWSMNGSGSFTNTTGEDMLIVIMIKPQDGNAGVNLSNPVIQSVTVTIQ